MRSGYQSNSASQNVVDTTDWALSSLRCARPGRCLNSSAISQNVRGRARVTTDAPHTQTPDDSAPTLGASMILRSIAINALRAVLRRDWKAAEMYYQLWQACRKPTPF